MINFFSILAQINQPFFVFTPPWFWFTSGMVLMLGDWLFLRKLPPNFRFIILSMGAAAIFQSLVLWRGGIFFGLNWNYLMYDQFENQIGYWIGVSITFIIWIRPVLIKRKKFVIQSSQEGTTITEILPGKKGRVLYEGSSWQAACVNAEDAIAAEQKVYILRREGNTLIVASEDFFNNLHE
jgi:membrane protein implicated in regulation of membrane protease activity